MSYSHPVFTTIGANMGNNLTEHGRKLAEIKAAKRGEALRANLKRRKESEAVKVSKGEKDAEPQNRE